MIADEQLVKPCIAKSGLYFSSKNGRCSGAKIVLLGFYMYTKSGDLNAYICAQHAYEYELTRNYKSYLYRSIDQAKRALSLQEGEHENG